MTISAIIVAAGSGQRLGGGLPKQYRPLAGRPVLAHAARRLASHPAIGEIRVVVGEGQDEIARDALEGVKSARSYEAARRGRTRSAPASRW